MLTRKDLVTFNSERERLNDVIFKYADLPIKRFFSLDGQMYRDNGVLPEKFKELMGLVASLVLRCDDCIKYHTIQCFEKGISSDEFQEAAGIALIAGGSIVIPHLRRAMEVWDTLNIEDE